MELTSSKVSGGKLEQKLHYSAKTIARRSTLLEKYKQCLRTLNESLTWKMLMLEREDDQY